MRQQILDTYAMTLDHAIKLVADVECDRCSASPYEEAKHPAWVLGHLALASGMAQGFLDPDAPDGSMGGIPEAWMGVYAPGVPISPDRGVYPKKDELLAHLGRTHALAAKAFENASDELLASEFPNPDYRAFWPTIGHGAFYMFAYHEGWHLGQLSQWRRAAGYPVVSLY